MVTGSDDKTLCLWDLKDGLVLKKMEGHSGMVRTVAVSRNNKLIASGDENGELIAWDGDTGEPLTIAIKAHSQPLTSLDISPDSAVLATVSYDNTIKLWRTDTWQIQGNPINVGAGIYCVRYSPLGKHLAIVTTLNIQILNPSGVTKLKADCYSLVWMPDGTRLLSGGDDSDWKPEIHEWHTSTWKRTRDSWSSTRYTRTIWAFAVNSTGTLLASASGDNHVRLWRISDRRTVVVFSHTHAVNCVTFSVDGKYILCGGDDNHITEWRVPEDVLLEDRPNAHMLSVSFSLFTVPLLPSNFSQENFANGRCTRTRDERCRVLTVSDRSHPSLIFMRRLRTTITRQVSILHSRYGLTICHVDPIHKHDYPRCMHDQQIVDRPRTVGGTN